MVPSRIEPGIKCRHRLQARKAESAISGIVRKIIHVMRVIVCR